MEKYSCPGCGARFNGKRCRSCGYELFGEAAAHRTSGKRTASRKSSSAKPGKKHPLAGFALLLMLISALMPMLRNWGLKLEAMEAPIQPEPVLQPENMVILHQEDGITIFTTPEQIRRPDGDFCLYVHNESDMSVTVSAGEIQVNGTVLPQAALVCKARPGEIGKGRIMDSEDWNTLQLQDVRTLAFDLAALGQNGRLLFTTGQILITAEGVDDQWENS